MNQSPTGLDIPAYNFGFCSKIADNNVEPDRGSPVMKWYFKELFMREIYLFMREIKF
jgi:hypothetical protein